jgi:hypothetical protein
MNQVLFFVIANNCVICVIWTHCCNLLSGYKERFFTAIWQNLLLFWHVYLRAVYREIRGWYNEKTFYFYWACIKGFRTLFHCSVASYKQQHSLFPRLALPPKKPLSYVTGKDKTCVIDRVISAVRASSSVCQPDKIIRLTGHYGGLLPIWQSDQPTASSTKIDC